MSISEFDRLPSWSLDVRKIPVGTGGGVPVLILTKRPRWWPMD